MAREKGEMHRNAPDVTGSAVAFRESTYTRDDEGSAADFAGNDLRPRPKRALVVAAHPVAKPRPDGATDPTASEAVMQPSVDLTLPDPRLATSSRAAMAERMLRAKTEGGTIPIVPMEKLDARYGPDAVLLTSEAAAALLHVTRQTISQWAQKGQILTLALARRGLFIPAWQISNGKLIEGLETLQTLFADRPDELHLFMVQKLAALGNRTPAEALRAGNRDAVLSMARVVAADAYS